MTILYIHGLNGSLSPEKRTILEQYGTVISPSIDYHNIPNAIEWLYDTYKNKTIDIYYCFNFRGFLR